MQGRGSSWPAARRSDDVPPSNRAGLLIGSSGMWCLRMWGWIMIMCVDPQTPKAWGLHT